MELVGQRRNVAFVITDFGYSERQACKLLDLDRTSYRYQPKPERNAELRAELIALARQKPRYGYRRLHVLLARRGWLGIPDAAGFCSWNPFAVLIVCMAGAQSVK